MDQVRVTAVGRYDNDNPPTMPTARFARGTADEVAATDKRWCGNGVVDCGEECDGGDACAADCTAI